MLGDLQAILKAIEGQSEAPVHKWNPDFCGDINMRIARDGTWYYEGTPIGRPEMVKLFSRVLRLDDDERYYLVTPGEKLGIQVDDVPFLVVEVTRHGEGRGQKLTFRTLTGDLMLAGPDNPIRVEINKETGEPAPYIRVRHNLDALINRPVFYELVALAEPRSEGDSVIGVWSENQFYELGDAGA